MNRNFLRLTSATRLDRCVCGTCVRCADQPVYAASAGLNGADGKYPRKGVAEVEVRVAIGI